MIKRDAIVIGILAFILAGSIFIIVGLKKRYKNDQRAHEIKIETLEGKLKVISSARSTLQQALKKSIRKQLKERQYLEDEIKRREFELHNLGAENLALKMRIGQLEQEKGVFNERLASFKKLQDKLEFKIKRLLMRPKVELGEVIVRPSSLNGKILKANRAYNFVIIDLGKNDGIKPGMCLTAYRQDDPIGELVIEKVYDELSVGKAAFEWLGNELDAGDIIKGKE